MKDKKDVIILILSIIVLILVIVNVVFKLNADKEISSLKNENKTTSSTSSSTTTSSTTTSATEKDEITASEISVLIKDYYKSQNFWDEKSTDKWDFNTITYLGHYSSDKDSKYFVVKGNFTCKDNLDDCVYVEQDIDDKYNFVSAFVVSRTNDKYNIKELLPPTFDKQVTSDPDTKKDFVLINNIIK